ncbi:HK97 family phage prohead protease [Pseudonocardia hispaniensis]|uniref:HK97 family phage prohead protease n=1 Tax=Pseudonocardia hispaniensis TaxID=904933 RepID=A0ABW1J7X1_9PSEU
METLRDMDLVRAVPRTVDLRADDSDPGDGSLGLMSGHFSVFDTWYEIDSWFEGRFLERTAPGAFRKTLAEGRDTVKVLFNHGTDFHIGDKVLGRARDVREDEVGAYYEVPLLDTSYNRDLLPGLRAGAYGSSFMFRVVRDEWNDEPGRSDYNPDGLPERTIKEVRVFEFGPVTFPANPDATAGVRSMTDQFYERMRARNPDKFEELRSRVLTLRTPEVDAARVTGTSTDGAAESTDAPAASHPSGLTPSERRTRLYPFLKEDQP